MTTETTRQLVERWIDAVNDHDADAYLELLADDYEEVSPSQRLIGKEAAATDIRGTFSSQPDLASTVLAMVVADGVAAVEYRMTGTLAGDLHYADGRTVPATGSRYDMDGCSFLWTRGDRITAVHHYWDRALMREQLGL